MSSWKKATKINQKTHLERQQLKNRHHLGFLEKKKDYKKRANFENRKKELLTSLKKKSLNKNPDEFYFRMINSKEIDGHDKIKVAEDTPQQISLMYTRDLKYIIMKRTIEKRKIQKLQSQLHFLDKVNETPRSHLLYSDTEHLQIDSCLLNECHKLQDNNLSELEISQINEKNTCYMNSKINKMYRKLEKHIRREEELGIVQRKIEMKKYFISSVDSQPKLIKSATTKSAPVYKWKQERKK